eukprot:TRINITY_DN1254_c0_g1_i3.p3 TRINITY_DN1254_c0_g1~~TRINITY_DN1254_c0_g1_i3.p3  ORF type:complete len:106 (+),score=26.01 TRINITY_DN1254_c0_g1_i3:756-1073(+)
MSRSRRMTQARRTIKVSLLSPLKHISAYGCDCKNGGTCDKDNKCKCPKGYAGKKCEIKEDGKNSDQIKGILKIVCIVVLALAVVITVIAGLIYLLKKKTPSYPYY